MPHYCWLPSVPPVSVSSFRSLSYTFRCTNIVFFLSIFLENLHPFCELKILYYLCIPFRTQNSAASNQVVFSDGLHVMSLPEGVCERVVIGSQARLRIWCLRAYGFESLRSHFIKRSRSVPRSPFLRPRVGFGQTLRASRFRTPLSLRDISRGRTETSVAVSVARTLSRGRGVFPGLFFFARESGSGQSLRASRFRTPLSLRDISRGRTETSVAVSVARTFFRDRGVFPGLFFYAPAGGVRDNRSGPRGLVPLCHCVTSHEGERKRLSPFRSLARYQEIEECSPVSFFSPASRVWTNAQGLAVSYPSVTA